MSDPLTLESKCILVVEDEFLLADDLSQALAAVGAIVIGPTPSVANALVLVGDTPKIDLAVLDINLRGVLSYPVAEQLKQRAVPFIFTAGYDQALIPEQYGEVPRISKPYDRKDVLELLRALL